MKKRMVICSLFVLIVASCHKDKEPTRQEVLQSHTWVRYKTYLNDVSQFLPSCQLDDLISFKPGGSFVIDQGPTKCSSTEQQTIIGNWALDEGGTTLTITGAGFLTSFAVLALTNDVVEFETANGTDLHRIIYKRKL